MLHIRVNQYSILCENDMIFNRNVGLSLHAENHRFSALFESEVDGAAVAVAVVSVRYCH